ncbi:MAG: response regulator [bacterium]
MKDYILPKRGGEIESLLENMMNQDNLTKETNKGKVSVVEKSETIRVKVDRLNELMNLIGELVITKIRYEQQLVSLKKVINYLKDWDGEWKVNIERIRNNKSLFQHPEIQVVMQLLERNNDNIQELRGMIFPIVEDLSVCSARTGLVADDLQEGIMRVRMLPVASIFDLFPRLIRDMAKEMGKKVELVITGSETEVDKKILEEIKDPLIHLIRNAIDHGVESPEERKPKGKGEQGKISLSAYYQGNQVVIEIEDDGKGIDIERIKEVALKRKIVDKVTLEKMSLAEIYNLIFVPGFSTSPIITDVSGRGVGMDVVKTNVEQLKGTISINSTLNKGSRFTIKLPLTLATSEVLLVIAGGEKFAIPIFFIEETIRILPQDISTVKGREVLYNNGITLTVGRLSTLLNLKKISKKVYKKRLSKLDTQGKYLPVVVLKAVERRCALIIDELLGEQEIVIKSFGPQIRRVNNFSGVTIMGDGGLVMILNPIDLVEAVNSSSYFINILSGNKKEIGDQVVRKKILVVDDSITTRDLEKNILQVAGFDVDTASDGQEALEMVNKVEYDVVVTDVQMPKVDGFQLTSILRRQEKNKSLPIIMVTSLESEEDKRRGIEAGVDAYITKGAFDQNNLLDVIKKLSA